MGCCVIGLGWDGLGWVAWAGWEGREWDGMGEGEGNASEVWCGILIEQWK